MITPLSIPFYGHTNTNAHTARMAFLAVLYLQGNWRGLCKSRSQVFNTLAASTRSTAYGPCLHTCGSIVWVCVCVPTLSCITVCVHFCVGIPEVNSKWCFSDTCLLFSFWDVVSHWPGTPIQLGLLTSQTEESAYKQHWYMLWLLSLPFHPVGSK